MTFTSNFFTFFSLCSLLITQIPTLIGLCYGAPCIDSEKAALLKLKDGLTYDPSNPLGSWSADADCCTWPQVICDDSTGHVLELHLRTLSWGEYVGHNNIRFYSSSSYYYYYYSEILEYEEYYEKAVLGGKVSPSLLQLKHLRYLDFSNNYFGGIQIPTFLGSMESLKYLNLSQAGFGGMIPHQLGNLSNLQYLNLRGNYLNIENLDWLSNLSSLEFLDLSFVNLSKSFDWLKKINSFPSLVELHLSHCQLSSTPPLFKVNFSSLAILDLSSNHMLQVENLDWISNLSSLQFLDLSYVNLSKSFDWLKIVINSFPSLVELHLSWCTLSHFPPLVSANLSSLAILDLSFNFLTKSFVPSWVSGLKNLVFLDLSYNNFEGPIPNVLQNMTSSIRELYLHDNYFNSSVPEWLYGFNHLQILNLRSNELQGTISSAIGNLTSLVSLDLSYNKFEGAIPRSFKNLCKLRYLSLSGVRLNQDINDVLEILSWKCVSDELVSLDLYDCQLSGHLTDHLSHFKNLTVLDLSYNLISGPIPVFIGEMTSLKSLYLDDNKLNGTLPISFGRLTKLVEAYISYNALEGDISQLHFANLTNLRFFYASEMKNNIALRVSSNWIPPLQLDSLYLGSWKIGAQLPIWLRSLKHLSELDLSNSEISSVIPNWFWNLSSTYSYLNLSHNQIHGVLSNMPHLNTYSVIDLSNNNFNGRLPYFSSNMSVLDISNNAFSGSISNFLCHKMHEMMNMQVLNLGKNLLSGKIPNCWMKWPFLGTIKLSNNRFSGNIPKSIGILSGLQSLHLEYNNLSGEIPVSLANCTSLVTLVFNDNKLVGNIPRWIAESFSSMIILNLRTNKFDGHIPKELCRVSSLHILDLAHNNLSGTIPSCFNNFSAMARANDSTGRIYFPCNGTGTFYESAFFVMKGQMVEYNTIIRYVRIIDLSNNNLSGEIPMEITHLAGLQSLNLSQNAFTGRIPKNIGAMHDMESIDLSQNQLSGKIPESISNLSFLSQLNLSNNKLWGRIPTGTQLQTFDPSSFYGNQLCGLPLTNNCSAGGGLPAEVENGKQEDDNVVDWFYLYVSIAPGFVVGFWVIVGPLCFNRQWRFAYFHFLDNLWDKIWWSLW